MKLKPYPKYKDSGIEWLGEIPEDWETRRLKFLISRKITDGPHESPEFIANGIPFLSVDGIQEDRLIFEGCRYISEEDHKKYITKCNPKKGDVLLGKAASVGKVAIVQVDFEFSVWSPLALIRLKKEMCSKFLYYSLKSRYLQDQIYVLSTSNTQHNLSMDDIPKLWFPFPKFNIQCTIADFLDRETEKIDRLIEKKQKLMELLREKRTALISQAVTKGLDPDAKMKHSGVDWLGKIPQGWKVKNLKYIILPKKDTIKTGPFGSDLTRDDYVYDEENIYAKVYTQQNVIEGNFDIGDDYITVEKYRELSACTLYSGDVVLTTRGTIGKSVIFPKNAKLGIMHPCLLRVQLDERCCLKDFFRIVVQESKYFFDQLLCISNATTIEVIYSDTLKSMLFVLPSIEEQKKILRYTQEGFSKIDKIIQKIKVQIEKLKEYHTVLISEAVTGKIKVLG